VSSLDAEASADSLLVNRHGSLGYTASSPCTPQSLKSEYHLAVNTALVRRHARGIQVRVHALFAKHIPDTFEKYRRVASLEEGVEQVERREQQIFRGNCATSSSVDGHCPYTFPLHPGQQTSTSQRCSSSQIRERMMLIILKYSISSMLNLFNSTPGAAQTTYEIPADEDIQVAKMTIHLELARSTARRPIERLKRRELFLQERYAELELERKESEIRVGGREERPMADAEALNEANVANKSSEEHP